MTAGILDAVQIMVLAHGEQKRDEGGLYITHPIAVAQLLERVGYGSENHPVIITALLHDVIEDTPAKGAELLRAGFSPAVIQYVCALTKPMVRTSPNWKQDYYDGIRSHPIAAVVKGADRIHNLCTMGGVWKLERQQRYIEDTITYVIPVVHDIRLEKILFQTIETLQTDGWDGCLFDRTLYHGDLKS